MTYIAIGKVWNSVPRSNKDPRGCEVVSREVLVNVCRGLLKNTSINVLLVGNGSSCSDINVGPERRNDITFSIGWEPIRDPVLPGSVPGEVAIVVDLMSYQYFSNTSLYLSWSVFSMK